MKDIVISNGIAHVLVRTDSARAIYQIQKGFYDLIPGYRLATGPIRATLEYKKSKNMSLQLSNERTLQFSYDEDLLGDETLGILLSRLIELINQENNEFTLHSSAVEKENHGTIFYGPTNSGKTTLAALLCAYKGFKLVSTDLTRLHSSNTEIILAEGTRTIHLNTVISRKLFGISCPKEKVEVSASSIHVNYSEERPILNNFYILRGDIDFREGNISPVNEKRLKILLYQDLSGIITGSASCLLDSEGQVIPLSQPNLDNKKSIRNRKNLIERILAAKPHAIRGNFDYLMELICQ